MLTLLKNCDAYAPSKLGKTDILLEGSKIAKIAKDLSDWETVPEINVMDMGGRVTCPGLIDIHVHITGGGGEQGPASRTPELMLTDFTLNGVTTVVGLLGTDGISRSVENLLFKARALENEGITTFALTGNYNYPSPTITGSVEKDIATIDKFIGVKLALSDHRGPMVTVDELSRLAADARVAGMLSGKPGIVTIHMGSSEHRMEKIFEMLERTEIPIQNILPTHCGRNAGLIADAVKFNKMGGTVDFTAHSVGSVNGVAKLIHNAVNQGADLNRVTMSSDAGGSQPKFDETGRCIGLTAGTGDTLLAEIRRLVENEDFQFSDAISLLTKNPARVLGQEGVKGCLEEGADADILVLDKNYKPYTLLAKGKLAVEAGTAVMKGYFE